MKDFLFLILIQVISLNSVWNLLERLVNITSLVNYSTVIDSLHPTNFQQRASFLYTFTHFRKILGNLLEICSSRAIQHHVTSLTWMWLGNSTQLTQFHTLLLISPIFLCNWIEMCLSRAIQHHLIVVLNCDWAHDLN